MRYRNAIWLGIAVVLSLAGCGGGGSSASSAPPTDFAFGEFSGRAAVSNPPISNASTFVTATAFTGTFSSLKIRELNPSIWETRIIFASDLQGGGGLFSMATDGTDIQRLTANPSDNSPTVAANGKVLFQRTANGAPETWIMNSDGSGAASIFEGLSQTSFDLAGDKFSIITLGVLEVYTYPAFNGVIVPLPANGIAQRAVMSPDGTTVYAVVNVSGDNVLYSMPADGSGGSKNLYEMGADECDGLAVSPNGGEIAIERGINQIQRIGAINGETAPAILPGNNGLNGITYSPKGDQFIFGAAFPPSSPALYFGSAPYVNFSRMTSLTSTSISPAWTPFIKDRTLISSGGGLLGTRACGVILGQRVSGGTTSVLAFDVTTPSSVVMTAQHTSPSSADSLVFSVDADNITKLAYANTLGWRGIRAIGSGTPVLSANGALVSIDGQSGYVVSILPFSGTRAAGSHPTVTTNGSLQTFAGNFLAAYDKNGNNVAPNGASVVELDTRTGALSVER